MKCHLSLEYEYLRLLQTTSPQLDNEHSSKDTFSCKVVELNQTKNLGTKMILIMALFEKLWGMEILDT